MIKQSQKKTPEQVVEAIFALNLDPIKLKLMSKKEGHGWTRAQADYYEQEYKRFLALLAKYPDEVIAPNTNVDRFWHGHILDTMKYAEDCEKVFGYFLHHYPYFGMRGEEDAANLANAFVKMQDLYEKEFGGAEAIADQSVAWCGAAKEKADQAAAWCGAAAQKADQSAAWCGATVVKDDQTAAWCGAAVVKADQTVAWCGATAGDVVQKGDQTAAWCGAVSGKAA